MNAVESGTFVLRLCAPGDERALSLIGQATILETYADLSEGADLYAYVSGELNIEKFRELLASDSAWIWAVETRAQKCIVGYAVVLSEDAAEPFSRAELQRLYLFHRFHGLGLGKLLMDAVLFRAHESGTKLITLRVNAQNAKAITFYRSYGFTSVSEDVFRAGARDYRVLVMQLTL